MKDCIIKMNIFLIAFTAFIMLTVTSACIALVTVTVKKQLNNYESVIFYEYIEEHSIQIIQTE